MCDRPAAAGFCTFCGRPLLRCPESGMTWHDHWADLIHCLAVRRIETGLDEGDGVPDFHTPHLMALPG